MYHGVRWLLPFDPHQLKCPATHPPFNEALSLWSRCPRRQAHYRQSIATPFVTVSRPTSSSAESTCERFRSCSVIFGRCPPCETITAEGRFLAVGPRSPRLLRGSAAVTPAQ